MSATIILFLHQRSWGEGFHGAWTSSPSEMFSTIFFFLKIILIMTIKHFKVLYILRMDTRKIKSLLDVCIFSVVTNLHFYGRTRIRMEHWKKLRDQTILSILDWSPYFWNVDRTELKTDLFYSHINVYVPDIIHCLGLPILIGHMLGPKLNSIFFLQCCYLSFYLHKSKNKRYEKCWWFLRVPSNLNFKRILDPWNYAFCLSICKSYNQYSGVISIFSRLAQTYRICRLTRKGIVYEKKKKKMLPLLKYCPLF